MFRRQLVVPLFMLCSTFLLSLYAPGLDAAHAPISKLITVNLNGGADYKTIQAAIDSIPATNNEWIKIHVTAGIYREKVMIDRNKDKIFIEGEGADKTSIELGDYSSDPGGHGTRSSATFTTYANGFIASKISFKNTYDGKANGTKQAVAAAIMGDMSAFYECRFTGVQDTLFDKHGRHYFKGCYVEGAIDFIFGDATSLYEECTIATVNVVDGGLPGPGFITANSRDADDSSGYVFSKCNITGSHPTYLGRPWKDHARVIFYQSHMSDVVDPKGWSTWDGSVGHEGNITYAESQCTGPGADTSNRVLWEKKLTEEEIKPFVQRSFIDNEGWMDAQPSI